MSARLRDLVWRAELPHDVLAARLGVTPRTLAAYLRADRMPAPVRALLEVYAGRVPWPGGERLVCVRGVLYPQDGADGVCLSDIPAYAYRLGEIDALRRELARYRAEPAQFLLEFT